MTTRELRNNVSSLCFCDIGEKDMRFISYANLALRTIYKELNILGRHTISTPLRNEGGAPNNCSSLSYNMKALTTDFQSFYLPPADGCGIPLKNAVFSDGIITVTGKCPDKIIVTYKRLPRKIHLELPESEIDIPDEHSELLTVLCAYFICLEDDRATADNYRELYNTLAEAHKNSLCERLGSDTVLTNGWA